MSNLEELAKYITTYKQVTFQDIIQDRLNKVLERYNKDLNNTLYSNLEKETRDKLIKELRKKC